MPAVAAHTRDPHGPRQRVTDERHPGDDLVGEGKGQGQVQVQMDDPPGLVLEAAPGHPDRGDAPHDQKAEGHGGGQHVRIRGEELPELVQEAGLGQLGVAERDEHDVDADEDEGPGRDPTVPLDQTVLAQRPLQPGEPGDEHQHEQHEVGPGEAGQSAAGDEQATRGTQRPAALPGDHQGQGDPHPEAGEGQEEIAEPSPGHMSLAATTGRGWTSHPCETGVGVSLFGGGHAARLKSQANGNMKEKVRKGE